VFDMDGLLVDTEHTWFAAEQEVARSLGYDGWGPADQAATVGGPMEHAARYLAAAAGSDLPWQEVGAALEDAMARLLTAGADHRPGAAALLDDLAAHAVPVALVSSSPRRLVDAVLASVGGEHFATTVAGDEVARTKPHPDPYLLAAARLGVDPTRCVVLEDSPTGIAAAEAAGVLVVAVPFVVPITPGHRRVVVDSLAELDTAALRALAAAHGLARSEP